MTFALSLVLVAALAAGSEDADLADLEPSVASAIREQRERALEATNRDEAAERWDELGRLYHAHGLFGEAERAYRGALARESSFGTAARHHLGLLLRDAARPKEAIPQFEAVVAAEPKNIAALVELGEAHRLNGDAAKARELFSRALALADSSAAARAGLAQIALSEGDATAAIVLLEAALRLEPRATLLRQPLAQAYRRTGDTARARQELALAGRIGVRQSDRRRDEIDELKRGETTHRLVGRTAFRSGDAASAERSFRRAVDAAPESTGARIDLAAALVALGRNGDAERQLLLALDLDSSNGTAAFNLARLLESSGRLGEALAPARCAAELSPNDGVARLLLARSLAAHRREGEALAAAARAVILVPASNDARLAEAALLVSIGDLRSAKVRLEEAHALAPNDGPIAAAYARFLAASPDESLRDGVLAAVLAEQVFSARPTAFHAETLALAWAEKGDRTGALRAARVALEIARSARSPSLEGYQELVRRLDTAPSDPKAID